MINDGPQQSSSDCEMNYYEVVTIPLQFTSKLNVNEVVYISQLTNQCH